MCDSFREYMAPNELKGRRLVGPDQAMMQAQDHLHEAHEVMEHGGPMPFVEASRHDYRALRNFGKRLERGGSMFKAGHIIG
jgi:hypothetical protein